MGMMQRMIYTNQKHKGCLHLWYTAKWNIAALCKQMTYSQKQSLLMGNMHPLHFQMQEYLREWTKKWETASFGISL